MIYSIYKTTLISYILFVHLSHLVKFTLKEAISACITHLTQGVVAMGTMCAFGGKFIHLFQFFFFKAEFLAWKLNLFSLPTKRYKGMFWSQITLFIFYFACSSVLKMWPPLFVSVLQHIHSLSEQLLSWKWEDT